MDNSNHRPRLRKGRRMPLNVTLSPHIVRALAKIGGGNRSAAIEKLVDEHLERQQTLADAQPEVA